MPAHHKMTDEQVLEYIMHRRSFPATRLEVYAAKYGVSKVLLCRMFNGTAGRKITSKVDFREDDAWKTWGGTNDNDHQQSGF